MTINLDGMARNCADRIAAYEDMLAHLDLDPDPADAPHLFRELRDTLTACARCPTPGRCRGWCAAGKPGTPQFCGATQAFRNLMVATEAIRIRTA